MSDVIKYRIGIINQFRNTYAFVDYKQYGVLQVWDGCNVSAEHKGFQEPSDAIHVFLNYKCVGKYQNNESAKACLKNLIAESPADLSDLEFHLLNAFT